MNIKYSQNNKIFLIELICFENKILQEEHALKYINYIEFIIK